MWTREFRGSFGFKAARVLDKRAIASVARFAHSQPGLPPRGTSSSSSYPRAPFSRVLAPPSASLAASSFAGAQHGAARIQATRWKALLPPQPDAAPKLRSTFRSRLHEPCHAPSHDLPAMPRSHTPWKSEGGARGNSGGEGCLELARIDDDSWRESRSSRGSASYRCQGGRASSSRRESQGGWASGSPAGSRSRLEDHRACRIALAPPNLLLEELDCPGHDTSRPPLPRNPPRICAPMTPAETGCQRGGGQSSTTGRRFPGITSGVAPAGGPCHQSSRLQGACSSYFAPGRHLPPIPETPGSRPYGDPRHARLALRGYALVGGGRGVVCELPAELSQAPPRYRFEEGYPTALAPSNARPPPRAAPAARPRSHHRFEGACGLDQHAVVRIPTPGLGARERERVGRVRGVAGGRGRLGGWLEEGSRTPSPKPTPQINIVPTTVYRRTPLRHPSRDPATFSLPLEPP
ncbi:hypothetical protein KM043_003442 [Ampulex compressa]|nr:hypothetical protein KM043_003442 [Ampulex compressa]